MDKNSTLRQLRDSRFSQETFGSLFMPIAQTSATFGSIFVLGWHLKLFASVVRFL
jgi:hypothetical protein